MYPYGLIGNCHISALIGQSGSLEWLCLPRPDSAPVFGRLLDPDGGHFSIEHAGPSRGKQAYLSHTNVLVTTITAEDESSFRIIDFCPRFAQHGRMFRPLSLFRIVEPVAGSPSLRVSCRPVTGWDKQPVKPSRGNAHLRFDIGGDELRLSTNMPLTYLLDESPFALKEPLYFGLTWSTAIEEDLVQVSRRFLDLTLDYWHTWVKHCTLPTLYQKETLRSALALKLHCYEETGAILAALTTSLPEEIGKNRNWDYRYCWLRDASFTLSAFYNLGHFEEMEGFIKFLLNIAEKHDHSRERLRPVYRLDQTLPLPETEHPNWRGYRESQPVRSDNQAADHVQNDVYGEMILTLAPIFFDERFHPLRTQEHEKLLEHLAKLCARNISQPDAGLWEFREGWREHSFSNLMCWAGLERIERIRERGFLPALSLDVTQARKRAEEAVLAAAKEGALRNSPTEDSLDSSLLHLTTLRFPDRELGLRTLARIHDELKLGSDEASTGFLYRYLRRDDFGRPQSAFVICSFWLVQALARTGKLAEARRYMERAMAAAGPLGLLSEHFFPREGHQTGNFPQAYSHVGQINAAFDISPPWTEVL